MCSSTGAGSGLASRWASRIMSAERILISLAILNLAVLVFEILFNALSGLVALL